MDSSVLGILVALFAVFLVLKFVRGMIKLAVLAAIVLAVIYFLSQGSL